MVSSYVWWINLSAFFLSFTVFVHVLRFSRIVFFYCVCFRIVSIRFGSKFQHSDAILFTLTFHWHIVAIYYVFDVYTCIQCYSIVVDFKFVIFFALVSPSSSSYFSSSSLFWCVRIDFQCNAIYVRNMEIDRLACAFFSHRVWIFLSFIAFNKCNWKRKFNGKNSLIEKWNEINGEKFNSFEIIVIKNERIFSFVSKLFRLFF